MQPSVFCCLLHTLHLWKHTHRCWVRPEGSGVVVDGLLVPTIVFQEVGIVVVDFGIVRQRLDTRAKTIKRGGEEVWYQFEQTNKVQTPQQQYQEVTREVFRLILTGSHTSTFAYRKRASLDSQTWFWWTVFQEKSRSRVSMETLRTVVPQRPTIEQRRPRPCATRIQKPILQEEERDRKVTKRQREK